MLERLHNDGFEVIFENGWQQIPAAVEANKLQSNLWFTNYYYEREKCLAEQQDVILERCLEYQLPFTWAQLWAKKITLFESEQAQRLVQLLMSHVPVTGQTNIIHLVCAHDDIRQRLHERGVERDSSAAAYWDRLRDFTAEYFSHRYPYIKIDTTGRSLDAVYTEVLSFVTFSFTHPQS